MAIKFGTWMPSPNGRRTPRPGNWSFPSDRRLSAPAGRFGRCIRSRPRRSRRCSFRPSAFRMRPCRSSSPSGWREPARTAGSASYRPGGGAVTRAGGASGHGPVRPAADPGRAPERNDSGRLSRARHSGTPAPRGRRGRATAGPGGQAADRSAVRLTGATTVTAPLMGEAPGGGGGEGGGGGGAEQRLRFKDFEFQRLASGRCRAKVVLTWADGRQFQGESDGVISQAGELRCCAEATVRALERVVQPKMGFELLGVKAVRAFDAIVVIVSLSARQESRASRLVGAYLAETDPPRGAALAVLNATNRLLGTFFARRWSGNRAFEWSQSWVPCSAPPAGEVTPRRGRSCPRCRIRAR